jgi:hypothetical protein
LPYPVTVEKRDHTGAIVFCYEGVVIERTEQAVCLVAQFGRSDVDIGCVVFRKGDTMTEWFFSDRWFNVFRLQDVEDGRLKGWYCNITRPAVIEDARVYADDLALDVFIDPAGVITLLDEDDFAALPLPAHERAAALAAVDSLRALAQARTEMFAEIAD